MIYLSQWYLSISFFLTLYLCSLQVRSDFREELQSRIDKATYLILRNLEENMIHIDLETVKYLKQCSAFILSLWSVLKLPRSSNDDRPSPTIDFPDCGVNIQLPPQFSQSFIAVRTLWLKYNHFSDLSRSWNKPQVSFDEEDGRHRIDFSTAC